MLVLWARRDAAVLRGKQLSIDMLRDGGLQSVAIANPEHAPYGRAAQAAIASLGLKDTLGPKLRVASNIAEAAQYADSGNAEVGLLSLTSAKTTRLMADGAFVPVPASAYPPILQGAVVVRKAQGAANGQKLLDFMGTPEMRALLQREGLMAPE